MAAADAGRKDLLLWSSAIIANIDKLVARNE